MVTKEINMVKNTQQQDYLDKIKWATSRKNNCDMSGRMNYCKYCKFRAEDGCKIDHDKRVEGSFCAKAFNKMKKGGKVDE